MIVYQIIKQHNQPWKSVLEKQNYLCLNVIFIKIAGRFTEKNTVLQLFFLSFNNINGAELQKKIFFREYEFFFKTC